MKKLFKKNKYVLPIIFLIGIGVVYRFTHLNWGAPFYFHPDERNIASAVTNLHFPNVLNPKFFAYGSLPIYFVYFLGVLANLLATFLLQHRSTPDIFSVSFEQAIIFGRVVSAILSLAILPLIYFIARKIMPQKFVVLSVILASLSVGLIQYAHFGTFETYLTFFSLLLFYLLLMYITDLRYRYFLFSAVILGILVALKISSFALLPLPLFAALLVDKKKIKNLPKKWEAHIIFSRFIAHAFLLLGITVLLFIFLNPYALLDFSSFRGSMQYESAVATGTLPVFYTDTFKDTLPVWYQLSYVYPFLLNPLLTVLFIPAFTLVILAVWKRKRPEIILLILFFVFLFTSQAVLFVKWTRYMVPTLPFIYLIFSYALYLFEKRTAPLPSLFITKPVVKIIIFFVAGVSILFSFAFVKTVYLSPDTRVKAADYTKHNVSREDSAISEVFDMGIVPFNDVFSSIELIDFYDLESNEKIQTQLNEALETKDVFILPSQRIIKSRLLHPEIFPKGYEFYSSLQNNHRFPLVYKTPCDLWCKITYLGDPIYSVEDTANVFDRPTVMIYSLH